MTTQTLSHKSNEGRIAVAVEMMVLTVAAIGLSLGLLAAPGDQQPYGAAKEGGIRATH